MILCSEKSSFQQTGKTVNGSSCLFSGSVYELLNQRLWFEHCKKSHCIMLYPVAHHCSIYFAVNIAADDSGGRHGVTPSMQQSVQHQQTDSASISAPYKCTKMCLVGCHRWKWFPVCKEKQQHHHNNLLCKNCPVGHVILLCWMLRCSMCALCSFSFTGEVL